MGGTSTLFAFEQALIANLTDATKHPALQGVTVTDGPPTVGELSKGEWMMFGNSTAGQTWKTFPVSAPTSRDEDGRIDLIINVVQAVNDKHTAITQRAYALLAEVENELRSNPSQGVPNVLWSEIAPTMRTEKATNPEAGWRETLLTVQVRVRSRI